MIASQRLINALTGEVKLLDRDWNRRALET
jgi:hypothetical protein